MSTTEPTQPEAEGRKFRYIFPILLVLLFGACTLALFAYSSVRPLDDTAKKLVGTWVGPKGHATIFRDNGTAFSANTDFRWWIEDEVLIAEPKFSTRDVMGMVNRVIQEICGGPRQTFTITNLTDDTLTITERSTNKSSTHKRRNETTLQVGE